MQLRLATVEHMTEKVDVTSRPRPRIRSGVGALVASIALVVWTLTLIYAAAAAISGPDWLGVVATIMAFASWVVIPVLVLTVLILAIIALLLNRVIGKIFGAFAIVLPVAAVILFLAQLGVFSTTTP